MRLDVRLKVRLLAKAFATQLTLEFAHVGVGSLVAREEDSRHESLLAILAGKLGVAMETLHVDLQVSVALEGHITMLANEGPSLCVDDEVIVDARLVLRAVVAVGAFEGLF